MLSLNIHMQSFELAKNIVQNDDTIRVSVTTLPGELKQAFSFEAKKMQTVHPFFSVKINEKNEKILIVLRKKSFSEKDPIIASTVINKGSFPTEFNNAANTELKAINLLEPLQHSSKKNSKTERKVVGKFEVQFSLTQELPCQSKSFKLQLGKKKNGQEYAKIDSFFNDENSLLYNDLITN